MSFLLPNPSVPTNGQPGDATPILQNELAIAQAIASFDGSQIQNGSVQSAALADNINPQVRGAETLANFVYSGCLWSLVSGFSGTMTGGVIYVNGFRTIVSGVGANTFAASSDTYVYISNLGNITYQAVSNNAASPSATPNAVLVAIIVTNGSTITVINQGTLSLTASSVAPVVSSNTLWKFDTLGNAIYPSKSITSMKVLQQRTVNATSGATTTPVAYNGFPGSYAFPAVIGRLYAITLSEPAITSPSAGTYDSIYTILINATAIGNLQFIWLGAYGSGANGTLFWLATTTATVNLTLQFSNTGAASGTWTFASSTSIPAQLAVTEFA